MQRSSITRPRTRRLRLICLRVDRLDDRALPSTTISEPVFPVIMAGYAKGSPTDSPSNRVDPNTSESPFAGVGSILVTTSRSTFIGSGTAIGPRHILTAAHVVDLNADGKVNASDGTQGVYFILNYGEDQSHRIAVSQFDLHPDYTGFNRPAINDDIAILTLAEDLPEGVPIYSLPTSDLLADTTVTMIGYGRAGDGVRGYTTLANPTIKRFGQNTVDGFYGQDDKGKPIANEVFRFDFDGPKGNGPLGGPTLGNDIETQFGSGDSGGPSFFETPEGAYIVVGVNSFVQGIAPRFGSMGGGMNVFSYLSFIESVLPYDMGRDLEGVPPVSEETPIIGPSTEPSPAPAPAKPGIAIGAKRVSVEMPTQTRESSVDFASGSTWAVGEDEKKDSTILSEFRLTETDVQENADSINSFEPLSLSGLVSIDLGLLSLAADGSLSIEE